MAIYNNYILRISFLVAYYITTTISLYVPEDFFLVLFNSSIYIV